MLIPQQQRDTAIAALARLDPLDVLAAIGALQLLPENANAIFRLEAAAGVASTAAPIEDGSGIADEAAIAWVNRPVFGAVADPFNNVFTDEFLFHYGSFVVFPGLREEAFFIVRMLARAVLHTRRDLPNEFFQPAQRLAAATLMLSDAVARKARLHRGVEPAPQTEQLRRRRRPAAGGAEERRLLHRGRPRGIARAAADRVAGATGPGTTRAVRRGRATGDAASPPDHPRRRAVRGCGAALSRPRARASHP